MLRIDVRWMNLDEGLYGYMWQVPVEARLIRVETMAKAGECRVIRLQHANVSSLFPEERYGTIDLWALADGGDLVCPRVAPILTSALVVRASMWPRETTLLYEEGRTEDPRFTVPFPPGPFASDYRKMVD